LHLIAEPRQKGTVLKPAATATVAAAPASDSELVQHAAAGDHKAFEAIMRRCNQQLFRIARGILKDDAEAEEAVQEGYVIAYRALKTFRGDAKLSTWLGRIIINESLGRLRRHKRQGVVVPFSGAEHEAAIDAEIHVHEHSSPEEATLRAEMRALMEQKIDELPLAFRTVFIMREVEEMTVEETAQCLGIPEATVRTRLFRAKGLLRESLSREIDVTTRDVFSFAGERCDRIVAAVLARIGQSFD
jgi:RNA polymerase sigma-70 factor, ECF subfamily